MTTILKLSQSTHFTLHSGLVLELHSSSWNIPQGRHGSLVCIFEANNGRLLYELEPNDSISFKSKLGLRYRLLGGTQLRVLAISRLSKTFSFQTDFLFDDIKIPTTVFTTNITIKEPSVDIAVAIIQGEDPLKNLCTSIKSRLDSMYRQVCFENVEQLNQFVDKFDLAVREMKLENRYLKLEVLDIEYNIAKFKMETVEKINKKKVMDSKLELLSKYRDKVLSEHSNVKDLQEIFVRIPQVIPHDITGVEELVINNVSDFIFETIRKYRDKTLSEHSEIEDLQKIIDLIPRSIPKREELVFSINSLVKPVIMVENEQGRTLLPSSAVSDATKDEKREEEGTPRTERKRRWRSQTSEDYTSNPE